MCWVLPSQLTKIVVTNGPGSYTGIRIGLTLGKVMAKVLNIKLVCLSSLKVMCGLSERSAIIDAKSKRVYYGKYCKSKSVVSDCVKEVKDLDLNEQFIGDTYLVGKESEHIDIIKNMFDLIDSVKAIYLKD